MVLYCKAPWELRCLEVSPSVHGSVSGVKVIGAGQSLSYAQGGPWYAHFFILKIDPVGKGLVLSLGQGKGGVAVKAREVERSRPGRVAGPSACAAGPPRGKAPCRLASTPSWERRSGLQAFLPRQVPPLTSSGRLPPSEGAATLSTSQSSRADEPSWNVLWGP